MNKKEIVDLIKKIGQGLEDMPELSSPGGGLEDGLEENPGVVRIGPGGMAPGTQFPVSSNGIRIIKSMQQGLVNLAQDVVSQINIEDMSGQGRAPGEAAGRNSFADFIDKNYLAKNDAGSVMAAVRAIGSAKGGLAVDGKWGPLTNAALHNVVSYASALLKLAGDFHFTPTSYTEKDLETLQSELPAEHTDLDATQKVDAASDIVKHLGAIRKMFGEIKNDILEKPANRAFIENDQPFHTYKHEGASAPAVAAVDPQTLANLAKQLPGMQISLQDTSGKWIPQHIAVTDLVSKKSLEAWQQAHAPSAQLSTILTSLRASLNAQERSLTNSPVQQRGR
jgi:hypothetical protein